MAAPAPVPPIVLFAGPSNMSTPPLILGRAWEPEGSVPMKFPWTRLLCPPLPAIVSPTPPAAEVPFPESTLATRRLEAEFWRVTPERPLPSDGVPRRLVPMKFPWTKFPPALMNAPSLRLAAITLPAPDARPPIVLLPV